MVTKVEWETIKAAHKNKCVICGKTEKQVGILEKAHIKARSKGGSQVLPMCPTHHRKYDQGKFTATEYRKIGLTPQTAKPLRPAKKKKDDFWSL